jgi:hypothetical protein
VKFGGEDPDYSPGHATDTDDLTFASASTALETAVAMAGQAAGAVLPYHNGAATEAFDSGSSDGDLE